MAKNFGAVVACLVLTACASAGGQPPTSDAVGSGAAATHRSAATGSPPSSKAVSPELLDISTVSPLDDRIKATFDTLNQTCDVEEFGGFIWVSDLDLGAVKIDPETNTVVGAVEVTGPPCGLAVSAGSLFAVSKALNGADSVIDRLDPKTGDVTGTLEVPFAEFGPISTTAEGELWAVNYWHEDEILRIDPVAFDVLSVLPTEMPAAALTVIGPYAWVTSATAKEVLRIETATGEISRIPLDVPSGDGVGGDENGIWTVGTFTKQILQLDYPGGHLRHAFRSPAMSGSPITIDGRLWAAATNGLLVLDTERARTTAFSVDTGYSALSIAAGDVWLHGFGVPLLRVSTEVD